MTGAKQSWRDADLRTGVAHNFARLQINVLSCSICKNSRRGLLLAHIPFQRTGAGDTHAIPRNSTDLSTNQRNSPCADVNPFQPT